MVQPGTEEEEADQVRQTIHAFLWRVQQLEVGPEDTIGKQGLLHIPIVEREEGLLFIVGQFIYEPFYHGRRSRIPV